MPSEKHQPRILVVDGYTLNPGDNSWAPLETLGQLSVHDRTLPEEVVGLAHDADILITNKCYVSAEAIAELPKLKFIAVTATGYNAVDVAAARQRGIPVSNVPEYSTRTVAQFTWALLLELCHHVGAHAESVQHGEWTRHYDFCYWLAPQNELTGKRLGLVGFGRIARAVAEIGRAFGMQVLASGRPGSTPPPSASVGWLPTDELFAYSDVVSLHCPLTPETNQMVNCRTLDLMQPSALLINTSRGGLVHEGDLANALQAGRIAGAAVDVVSAEPIAADNPLLTAPNCLITPHMAWTTLAARQRLMQATADNVTAFLVGKPVNVVN
ncbi:MAG: D-2-hydroxyacid dehydrogenase [Pirellulales bacterium]|nr:D-2-hydroxyacid dehydrogenase [Pirellulales bacterium]